MIRRASGRLGTGPLLIAGGIGAFIPEMSLANAARILIIVGVILHCSQKHREEQRAQFERLLQSNAAGNASYDLGKDIGYEEGYQARRDEERPVLVDLAARRGEAGEDPAMSSAANVVDRG